MQRVARQRLLTVKEEIKRLECFSHAMLELVQRAVVQQFDFLKQGTELSQKFFAKSLEVKTSSGLVDFVQEYFARVQQLTTDVMSAQAAFAGEITQAGYQSLVKLQAVPYSAPASDVRETSVGAGEVAEAQECSPVETVTTMTEATVVRRTLKPKAALTIICWALLKATL
jgi:hypothetical protein